MEYISNHITFKEAFKSRTAIQRGIDNTPTESQIRAMKLLALRVFEPLRDNFGDHPIKIVSFYRSFELNREIGGANGSQHMANAGAAMDIDVDGRENVFYNYQLFNYIKDHLPFDQLIWEYGDKLNPNWVHVSYREGNNRGQVLRCYKDENNKTKYELYAD